MQKLFVILSCCFAAGCATEAGVQSQAGSSTSQPVIQAAAPVVQSPKPAPPSPAVLPTQSVKPPAQKPGPAVEFSDLPAFDRELAASLSGATSPVAVTSADRILLQKMPPRLEKWLAAVDDSGGKIETQSVDPGAVQTRAIGLIFGLISAIRTAREFAKEHIYSEARKYDAKIFYKTDSSGERVVERVEWTPRKQ